MECAIALPLMTTGGCDRVCGSIAADDDGTVALPVAPMVALMKLQHWTHYIFKLTLV